MFILLIKEPEKNMRKIQLYSVSVCFAALLVLSGCSNPADNVPEAEVSTIQAAEQESASSTEPAIGHVYVFSPESSISFVGSKVTGSHDGGFKTFQGTFVMADENPETATGKIEIDTTSIWSDNERLTNHLKSADFFEVEKYPTSIFTVKEVKKADTGYQVSGELIYTV